MSKLTDLEICQRIAEIEGVKDKIEAAMMAIRQSSHHSIFATGTVTSQQTFDDIYNPLTDDALCFKLMIKYDIAPFKCEFGGYECVYDVDLVLSGSGVVNDENPNRAICLAIIESKVKV
jgi:hypothetical protein